MSRTRILTTLVVVSLLISFALAGCSTADSTSPAAQALLDTQTSKTTEAAASEAAGGEAILTVGDQSFTLAELQALSVATATTDDGPVTGISLKAVLEAAKGPD